MNKTNGELHSSDKTIGMKREREEGEADEIEDGEAVLVEVAEDDNCIRAETPKPKWENSSRNVDVSSAFAECNTNE